MNWIKKGFKAGNKACLVLESFYGACNTVDVDITHVDDEIVIVNNNGVSLEFKNQTIHSTIQGYFYTIYLNKGVYDNKVAEDNLKKDILEKINISLHKLDINDLQKLHNTICSEFVKNRL